MLFPALVGQKFSRLSVIAQAPALHNRTDRYTCICDCGATRVVRAADLKTGRTKSCGCYGRTANVTHGGWVGGKRTLTYRSWDCMVQRCTNPKHMAYEHYGGRGITIYPP